MPAPEFDIALPGDWWRIPVTDRAAGRASIHAYVEKMLGRADERAAARADLREHLGSTVDEARRAGGLDLFMGAEIIPGVQVPVTLTTYAPDLPERLSHSVGVGAAAESLAASLEEGRTSGTTEIGTWTDETQAVVREFRLKLLTAENGDQEYDVRVDYWLLHRDTTDTILLAFSSPLIWQEQLEPLLELFDAMVSTVDWQPAAARTAASAEA